MKRLVIMSDFDGTLIEVDTVRYILERFVDEDWKTPDDLYNDGIISIEECLTRQFPMIKLTRERIIEELDKVVRPRQYFIDFLEYCKRNSIPFMIVSAGFDFYIRHFLEQMGLEEEIRFTAPRTIFTDDGLSIRFPQKENENAINFKEDLVRRLQKEGKEVAYLGNGRSDLPALEAADFRLVVRGSRLAAICNEKGITMREFEDFGEVMKYIDTQAIH